MTKKPTPADAAGADTAAGADDALAPAAPAVETAPQAPAMADTAPSPDAAPSLTADPAASLDGTAPSLTADPAASLDGTAPAVGATGADTTPGTDPAAAADPAPHDLALLTALVEMIEARNTPLHRDGLLDELRARHAADRHPGGLAMAGITATAPDDTDRQALDNWAARARRILGGFANV